MNEHRNKITNPDSESSNKFSRVLGIGTYPPPITGQSVAFKLVIDNLNLPYLNISSDSERVDKSFSFPRVKEIFSHAVQSWKWMKNAEVVYLTGASSVFGMLRDALFIVPAWIRGKKTMVHIHQGNFDGFLNGLNPIMRLFSKWLYRRLFRIIVLSDRFIDQYSFADNKRIVVVQNGVKAWPKPLAVAPHEEVRILYLSNLMPQKGVLPLIEAMALLPPNYRCNMAGRFMVCSSDPYTDGAQFEGVVKQRIEELGLGDRVRLIGLVSGEQKDRLWKITHVLCLPTTYENEAQPLCVLEAMMAGVPAVTTDHRDLANMVADDRGRIVRQPDPELIAKAISEVTSDELTWKELSKNAYSFAQAHYTDKKHLQTLSKVFESALGQH